MTRSSAGDGQVADLGHEQLTKEDMLSDDPIDDVLDEGYSPPDRPPLGYNTWREHETLDERLAEEIPDPDADADEDGAEDSVGRPPAARAGRLVAPDAGMGEDVDSDVYAQDVGVDGAGASAEEAAVHLMVDDQ
jgi:Family of unknown function (DUF5709)